MKLAFLNSKVKTIVLLLTYIGFFACLLTIITPIYNIFESFTQNPIKFIDGLKSLLLSKIYLTVLSNTFLILLYVIIICILFGTPIALYLWRAKNKIIIIAILCIPFLMNQVARNYAWIQILDSQGVVNHLLISLGIIKQPIQLLYNRLGVAIVLAQGFLPIYVFNLYISLIAFPYEIVEASYCSGKSRIKTFLLIIFPNIYQGIIGGVSLIAILSFGYFITPAMLGGSGGITLPKLLYDEFNIYGGEFNSVLQSLMLIIIILPFVYFSSKHILRISKF